MLKNLSSIIAVALVAGVTLLSGVIHGHMSHRWGPTRDSLEAAKKLRDIPDQFGDWRLAKSEKLDADVVEVLQCTGYANQVYVNQKSGETVQVALLLGPSGPMSVHSPEICYSSVGNKIVEPTEKIEMPAIDSASQSLWKVGFQRTELLSERFRVYYAWSVGANWIASSTPRVQFAGYPYLYKIELSVPLPRDTSNVTDATDDAGRRFLGSFLPVIKEYLIECNRKG